MPPARPPASTKVITKLVGNPTVSSVTRVQMCKPIQVPNWINVWHQMQYMKARPCQMHPKRMKIHDTKPHRLSYIMCGTPLTPAQTQWIREDRQATPQPKEIKLWGAGIQDCNWRMRM
mmetsp:Transcript_18930/g.47630  ORF Transcript_18930/g.47630 Transcript_18930/m.47630 type:complete len:118 (-) Transcript_18930:2825-3178(-)